jgi:hypothetical protein
MALLDSFYEEGSLEDSMTMTTALQLEIAG